MRTQPPDEALGEDAAQARGEQVGLDAHVDETHHGGRRVVRVEGGEDEVAGQRGAHGDLRGLRVARLAHEHHVGILPEDVSETVGERQPDLGLDLDLADRGQAVLHRILDRHDVAPARVERAERGVERCRFARTGGPGDDHHAVGKGEEFAQAREDALRHPERGHRQEGAFAVEQAHHDPFAVGDWDGGDADVDDLASDAHLRHAVLGQAALGDVHAGHDLDAGDERRGVAGGRRRLFVEHAVKAEAHAQRAFGSRVEMDVGGIVPHGVEQHVVEELRDGLRLAVDEQVVVRPCRGRGACRSRRRDGGGGGLAFEVGALHGGCEDLAGGEGRLQILAGDEDGVLERPHALGTAHQQRGDAVDAHGQHALLPRPRHGDRGDQLRVEHGAVHVFDKRHAVFLGQFPDVAHVRHVSCCLARGWTPPRPSNAPQYSATPPPDATAKRGAP